MKQFECEHCHVTFNSAEVFDRHYCDRMEREDLLGTHIGQSALALYKVWMSELNRPYPGEFIFMTSKHFKPLLKFVVYSKRVKLPRPSIFVKWVTKKNYPPALWQLEQLYVEYINYIDNEFDPIEAVIASIRHVTRWCEDHNVDTSEFFDHIESPDLLDMIQLRTLSPWMLIFSTQFKTALTSTARIYQEHKILIENIIKPDRIISRINDEQIDVDQIKMMCESVGLR